MPVKDSKEEPKRSSAKSRHEIRNVKARKSHIATRKINTPQNSDWVITDEHGDKVIIEVKTPNVHFFGNKASVPQATWMIEGFSYSEVEPMIEFLDFNQKESAAFLEVDPGTISRWKKDPKKIGRLRSKNLLDIDGIIAKGVRIFGGEEEFKEWLNTTNYALGDIAPIELLKDPYGVEFVDEAIDGLSWGSFV